MDDDLLCNLISMIIAIIILCAVFFIGSNLDKSTCSAYVNGKNIYNGRCYFLRIDSIGENGNTKKLTIYKDKLKIKPVKKYVANDIEIKESEEN